MGTLTRMAQQNQWTLDRDIREDADSVFVPAEDLPLADVGDVVQFSTEQAARRRGHVTALVEDGELGPYFTVELESPAV